MKNKPYQNFTESTNTEIKKNSFITSQITAQATQEGHDINTTSV